MKDIIQLEKEDYPKIVRTAKGKIDDVFYVLTLQYNKHYSYSWRVKLHKEEIVLASEEVFAWRFFANRYFSKLIARHNFKEEQEEV